ncbi:MAG: EutN/CcmL family microcompartment protein [Acidobacteriia bacterium]|nr:EutN/CcmL family microcompartment protein [Terriglobia bacterium]
MYLGRVVGCVWATVKDPSLEGQRMLVIQPLTPDLRDTGKRLICLDTTGAGAGETIYWVRGKEASFPFLPKEPPVDTTVVGIVDSVHLREAAPPSGAPPHGGGGRKARRKGKPC